MSFLLRRARTLAAIPLVLGTLVGALVTPTGAGAAPDATPLWQPVAYPTGLDIGAMVLLTNGSVMMQDQGPTNTGTSRWWLLSPNSKGSYVDGTWHQIASLASGYGPQYFASGVLPDGRVVVEGGEFDFGKDTRTNQGAIYNPLTNTWTSVAPPEGTEWSTIGDAPSVVLATGTFMLGGSGNYTNRAQALLDPSTLTWTATGTGKPSDNEEEGFTLLQNDDVLTVGLEPVQNTASIYHPTTGTWTSAGVVPVPLVTAKGTEIGPQVLLPDGTVLVVGSITGDTALYHPTSNSWTAGPSFPIVDGAQPGEADGPAAVLPDGDVLLQASPGTYKPPSHFFVYDGSTMTQVPGAPKAATVPSSNDNDMLMLPTGQVLDDDGIGQLDVYNGGGRPQAKWRPVVKAVPKKLAPGKEYTVSGDQLSGITEGASYGDDYNPSTNYPLVRLTYRRGHRVVYARTFDMSSVAVTPMLASHADFELPKNASKGAATLVVVANGIASLPVRVKVL